VLKELTKGMKMWSLKNLNPWRLTSKPGCNFEKLINGKYVVCGFSTPPNLRNALLISAAPDMLEALEKLACLGNGEQYGNSICNQIAIKAIEKATGVAK
jgi:hypothetical protein